MEEKVENPCRLLSDSGWPLAATPSPPAAENAALVSLCVCVVCQLLRGFLCVCPDCDSASLSSAVTLSLLTAAAQTEMKKVVGDNATLPCHHQFPSSSSLDIEWLLQMPNTKQQKVVGHHTISTETPPPQFVSETLK